MLEYYIHQIGDLKNEKTYERLLSILKSKTICSRDYLEKQGIKFENDNPSFKLDISDEKKWMYCDEDVHKDKISLSDPQNNFIRRAIERRKSAIVECFKYNYIAFAISRDVKIVPSEQTHGLAIGEVQVQDKIDSEYIVGLILPIPEEQLSDKNNIEIIDAIANICKENNFPLDIYNYEGILIRKKEKKHTK